MANHSDFEELCALAPLGELSSTQLHELDEHITECADCRQAMLDYERIFRQVVPAVTRSDEEFIASRKDSVRAAVLRGVAAIDASPVSAKTEPLPFYSRFELTKFRLPLLGAVAATLLAAISFWIGARFYRGPRPRNVVQTMAVAKPPAVRQTAPKPTLATADNGVPKQNDVQEKQLTAALDAERQHSAELASKLSVEDNELAQAVVAQDALRAQINQQTQVLVVTKAELDAKKVQLEQVQAAKSSDTATVVSLEYQVQDLTKKLDTQTASLDRERDLLSHGREIRDIIGARNLHIIDIADTDTEGATKKPFARAFYTEGKSLIYYAYDLPQRRADETKYSYVAWGESNGNKESIKKIGILFHDDQTQKRWSLNFADPNVLREIDSVFITLERNDDNLAQPKGKRMLTAYLGTAANHP